MWVLLSAVVASCCMIASGFRLAWAVAPLSLDAALILRHLRERGVGWDAAMERAIETSMGASPRLARERGLWAALGCRDAAERDALLNEELLDLRWHAERWARVPRVSASISTSAGFLLGCIGLIEGLSNPATFGDVGRAVTPAIDALSVSIAGASFCIAVHMRAGRAAKERLAAMDRLVDRLQDRVVSSSS
jgi:hypothetical protein